MCTLRILRRLIWYVYHEGLAEFNWERMREAGWEVYVHVSNGVSGTLSLMSGHTG
jgi:transcription initiation factor IIE alpha subunit